MTEEQQPRLADAIEDTSAQRLADRRVQEMQELMRRKDELIIQLQKEVGIFDKLGDKPPPTWMKSPKKSKGHNATPWLLLSDLHLDEVVTPDQIGGVNAFDRRIAQMRLEETVNRFIRITRDYWSGITYDGVVVCLGGDIFSGDIHEELKETNEDTIIASLDFWLDHVAAGLQVILDEFGAVHVPVVVGNHGRMSRKSRAKGRVRDNFDWFFGRQLARMFASDDRITFDVSESADCLVQSYGQTVCLTHGDQASGGAGIGGIWPPIKKMVARKGERYAATGSPIDLFIMGHWHNLVFGPEFIVNGSLKGYDDYAAVMNFTFEPPAQAAWLMTPEHGKTWTAPILPQDREAEGW